MAKEKVLRVVTTIGACKTVKRSNKNPVKLAVINGHKVTIIATSNNAINTII